MGIPKFARKPKAKSEPKNADHYDIVEVLILQVLMHIHASHFEMMYC